MSGQGDGKSGAGKSGEASREERLKAALRDNLRRRKAQVRGRETTEPVQPPPVDRTAEDER